MTLHTPAEVAASLKVTRRTVYRWIAGGQLPAAKAGSRVLISEADVWKFLKPNSTPHCVQCGGWLPSDMQRTDGLCPDCANGIVREPQKGDFE